MANFQVKTQKMPVIGAERGQTDNKSVNWGEFKSQWTTWRDCENRTAVGPQQQRGSKKAKRLAMIKSTLKAKEMQKICDSVCSRLGQISINEVTTSNVTPVCQDRVTPVCQDRVTPVCQDRVTPVCQDRVTPVCQDRVTPVCQDRVTPVCHDRVQKRHEKSKCEWLLSLRASEIWASDTAQARQDHAISGSTAISKHKDSHLMFGTRGSCGWGSHEESRKTAAREETESEQVQTSVNGDCVRQDDDMTEDSAETFEHVMDNNEFNVSSTSTEGSFPLNVFSEEDACFETLLMCRGENVSSSSSSLEGAKVADSSSTESADNHRTLSEGAHHAETEPVTATHSGSTQGTSGSCSTSSVSESTQQYDTTDGKQEKLANDIPMDDSGCRLCPSDGNMDSEQEKSPMMSDTEDFETESFSDDRSLKGSLCSSQPSEPNQQEDYDLSPKASSRTSDSNESIKSGLSSARSSVSCGTTSKASQESRDAFTAVTGRCIDSTADSESNISLSSLISRSSAGLSDSCESLTRYRRRAATSCSSDESPDDDDGSHGYLSNDEQTSHDVSTRGCPAGARNRLWKDEDDAWRKQRYNWFANGARGQRPCENDHSDNDLPDDEHEDSTVSIRKYSSSEIEATVPAQPANSKATEKRGGNISRKEIDGKEDCDQNKTDVVEKEVKNVKKRKPVPTTFVFSSSGVFPTGVTSSNWASMGKTVGPSATTVTNHPMCRKRRSRRKKRTLTPNIPDKLTVIRGGTHTQALIFQQMGGQCRVNPFPHT